MLGVLSVGLLVPAVGELLERPFARLGSIALRQRGRRLRARSQPGSRLRALRRAGAHRHLRRRRPPSRRVHRALRDARSTPLGVTVPLLVLAVAQRATDLDVAAPPPAHRPQGGRRRARRHHARHRLQLARRAPARRARLHHGARGPHRVDRLRLHPAPPAERRASEPVRRGQCRGSKGRRRPAPPPTPGSPERAPRLPGRRPRPRRPAPSRAPAPRRSQPCSWPTRRTCPPRASARTSRASRRGSTRRATSRSRLSQLRGKVVLVDFWTYSCINCQRALPHVEGWYNDYKKDGFVVVGVSSPEFAFEHVVSNVKSAAGTPRHRLPGRHRRQPRHLGRLQQRVLAGRVPDRPDRDRPGLRLRRGRLRPDGEQHPDAALGQRRHGPARPHRRPRQDAHQRRRSRPRAMSGYDRLDNDVGTPVAHDQAIIYHAAVEHPLEQPRLRRDLDRPQRGGDGRRAMPRSTCSSRPTTSTWS